MTKCPKSNDKIKGNLGHRSCRTLEAMAKSSDFILSKRRNHCSFKLMTDMA